MECITEIVGSAGSETVGGICVEPRGGLHQPMIAHMRAFASGVAVCRAGVPRLPWTMPPGTTHTMPRQRYIEIDRSTERRS